MKIQLDKISSVTKNIDLPESVEISDIIPVKEGTIIIGEITKDKAIYNTLELPSGRQALLQKGDIIAVALGRRRALKGFVGDIPASINQGDIIQLLNMGGVAGRCLSASLHDVGHAFPIRVIGAAMKNGKILNIDQGKKFSPQSTLKSSIPLIIVSGTCMNVGKTTVACKIIKYLSMDGYKVFATKMAGVAALKDLLSMEDSGAQKTVSFVDAGLCSTVEQNGISEKATKGAINYLTHDRPDYIIVEFGDGILGEYGVLDILGDLEIQNNIVCHIGCAHDPVGAYKLVEICAKIGSPVNIISGPVSDNIVGTDFIKVNLNIAAYNAYAQAKPLYNHIKKII